MQIQDGDRYYVGTRTTTANAAGVFSVNLNAHIVNTTGATVTVTTADGKTASTLVKTYLPNDTVEGGAVQELNGNNLNFTVDMPSTIVMNQTYAVTAKLTDKWGNPVRTSTEAAVHFLGTGSIQVNGVSTEVERQFNASGEATVFIRSVKDIAGPGSLEVTLQGNTDYTVWNGTAVALQDLLIAESTTDDKSTAWDERTFKNSFSADVQVLETAPAASADAKVNAGSFNGYVAVYAKGYKGQTLSWKIAGQWFKTTITEDYQVFQRTTAAVGVDVTVELYINGQRPAALVKQVLTR
jgi:hypothetical protein